MLQISAAARAGYSLRARPRQLAPTPVWGFRRRLLAMARHGDKRLPLVADSAGSESAEVPAPSSLTTKHGQAPSAREPQAEDGSQSSNKVAEASNKILFADQANQQVQAKAAHAPLEPWLQKVEGSAESVEAFRVVSQVLGMPLPEFLTLFKGRPYLLSKPVVAVLRPNAQKLVQRLGSKEAALRVVMKVLDALALWADFNDRAYMVKELKWDVEYKPAINAHYLAGPMVQHLLRLCQQELGLSPKAMQRHLGVLDDPEEAITRLAFISHRHLHSKIKHTRGSDCMLEKDTTFLTEDGCDWWDRLETWAVMPHWVSFEDAFLESEEWAALEQEDAEFEAMVFRVDGLICKLHEDLERAVEVEQERAGAKISKE